MLNSTSTYEVEVEILPQPRSSSLIVKDCFVKHFCEAAEASGGEAENVFPHRLIFHTQIDEGVFSMLSNEAYHV